MRRLDGNIVYSIGYSFLVYERFFYCGGTLGKFN